MQLPFKTTMIQKDDRVLILGCGGMLGEAMYLQFKNAARVYATDIDVNEPWLTYLDVRDASAAEKALETIRPNYIVHLAALTDMEQCEKGPTDAYATNAQGVRNFLPYVRAHDIPFAYISTAGIFDGDKDEYLESDTPNPSSVYGKSKLEGEVAARSIPRHIAVRAGWMMGGGPGKDKKFINKVIKQLRAGATDLFIVSDKHGTPCYTYDLANIVFTLLDKEEYGIFHGACEGGGSRYDVAKFLVSTLGLTDKIQIHEVDSDYFKDTYFAPRPRSEKLLNTRLPELGLNLTRDWKECTVEYMQKFDWQV